MRILRYAPRRAGATCRLSASAPGAYDLATLLALRDWRRGEPIYTPPEEIGAGKGHVVGIETAYGLVGAGCALHDKAREVARLVRLFAAVAEALPPETFPTARPEQLSGLEQDVVAIPWDLETLADEILHGVPRGVVPLARLPVDGLTRGSALSLYQAVTARNIEPDLPLLERVKRLAEDAGAYEETLPTLGLRERVREALQAHGRAPLAEPLRGQPTALARFYAHPLVIAAQLAQGRARYTALRVVHRGLHVVFRRNETKDTPILLKTAADVTQWRERGAVEFLAEVGRPFEDGYRVDAFLIDMDPQHGYPLEALKALAGEVLRRVAAVSVRILQHTVLVAQHHARRRLAGLDLQRPSVLKVQREFRILLAHRLDDGPRETRAGRRRPARLNGHRGAVLEADREIASRARDGHDLATGNHLGQLLISCHLTLLLPAGGVIAARLAGRRLFLARDHIDLLPEV